MTVLLDTHVLLWWKGDRRRLSRPARRAIEQADRPLLSPISIWEISTLLRLGRIELDRDLFSWVQDLLRTDIELAELTAPAAADAGTWGAATFPGDPADRLIYTTAKDLNVPLVTKDDRLHAYAATNRDVRIVW